MLFTTLLYVALSVFLIGLFYKAFTWFTRNVGIAAKKFTAWQRFFFALKGFLGVLFSFKIIFLVKALVVDVLFQRRILKEDFLRWLMHMLIYGGFMLLLLMHALDTWVVEPYFENYVSTLNPYFFLRDLFGFLVILGLLIAVYRRFILKPPRFRSNAMDKYAIIILAVVMLSGFLLEATKITSRKAFIRMVEDYGDSDDEVGIKALESFWVEELGLVSSKVKAPFDKETLQMGEELHEMNCLGCHSPPQSAFASYALSRLIRPIAIFLDSSNATEMLWYLHFIACFLGLAYLPFSKMFHIISSPISLLANEVMDRETSHPANIATRQVMELDACTHCNTCSFRCSAAFAYTAFGNEFILPSEKLQFLKKLASKNSLEEDEWEALRHGVYLCTNCDRCTVVCPVGINLRDLWINVRERLIQKEGVEPLMMSPFSFLRGLIRPSLSYVDYKKPLIDTGLALKGQFDSLMDGEKSLQLNGNGIEGTMLPESDSFSSCFTCQNCTTVCPVVNSYERPEENLELLPHQIMFCLGLGQVDMAAGPKMLWDCVTCYQCQEHCPQNVEVTAILYELKNLAVNKISRKKDVAPE